MGLEAFDPGKRIPNRMTLEKVSASEPERGHGIGPDTRFTPAQRIEMDGILSQMGSAFDDPAYEHLLGSEVMYLLDLAEDLDKAPPHSEQRAGIKLEIRRVFEEAQRRFAH